MVIKPLEGIYKNEKGQIVDAVEIYANSKEIAAGIPTKNWEMGFLVNTETLELYSLAINGLIKEWKKV